jgi:hypothetical protein
MFWKIAAFVLYLVFVAGILGMFSVAKFADRLLEGNGDK